MTATWSTACPDWARRIVDGESLSPPPLFPAEADAAMAMMDALRIVDVAGSPPFGQSNRPWMRDFARAIFGAYDAASGRRLIREFFLLVAKKNAKSTVAATIMLTALLRNWRQAAEYYILAPTKEIANNSFVPIREMVRADADLNELIHVKDNERTFMHRSNRGTLKVIAADAETVGGKKGVGVLVDELWLFGKRANAASMLMEATGGKVSRPEAFTIYLSTQSDEPPAGVFKEKLDYFRRVRDGEIDDPRSLPVLFEFPKPMLDAEAYLDPANFRLTNPSLGLIVDADELTAELKKNQAIGPHALNVFLAKHLNVEIGQSLRADRWAGADVWARAADPTLTLKTLLDRSEVVVVGLDGGGLDDLLGLAVVGREKGSGRWLAWGRAFASIVALRRRKAIVAELTDFARQGDLEVFDASGPIAFGDIAAAIAGTAVPERPEAAGLPPDMRALVDVVESVLASGKLAAVGIDPYGVGLIVEALKTIGVQEAEQGRLVPLGAVSQGYKLQGAIKTTERKLDDRTLIHAGQPLMAWAVGNARTVLHGNAALVTKAASGSAKIDPLMALFDAVALMSANPESPASIYSAERGLRSFG